ncbi:MarR family winged helix-turn-helix transcriptional regulator [Virgibacillus halophilus]|uniref:MarR family winged helix-turn-helix transcriptional regulator n=1 Tax=Tigheibacillus halophilus TaxID=361280 RepID=UPI003627B0B3
MNESLDDTLGFAIAQTGRNLNHLMFALLKPFDITPEQWVVLKRLGEHNEISQKDLASISQKNQTTLTRILDLLIGKGLVQKKMSKDDRRSFLIEQTVQGRRLQQEIAPVVEDIYQGMMNRIPEDQFTTFKQVLSQINQGIDEAFQTKRGAQKE